MALAHVGSPFPDRAQEGLAQHSVSGGRGRGRGGGALGVRAGANGRASPRVRDGSTQTPEPEPNGWRRHGVRGAAHRVPGPAARARAPAAPCARSRAHRTRALPRREWGAGPGRWLSGPGDCRGLSRGGPPGPSYQSLGLTRSPCPLLSKFVFPYLCQGLSRPRALCLWVSSVSVPVSRTLLSLFPYVSLTFISLSFRPLSLSLSLHLSLFLFQCHCPCSPPTLNPLHLCVWSWGGDCQHLITGGAMIPLYGSPRQG